MELKKDIESLLFSSGKAMTEKELSELTRKPEKEVRKALEELKKEYDGRDTSLVVMDTGSGWKLNVREKYVHLVTKIVSDTELAFPLMETLAIIAYSKTGMQAEVIKSRGTNAYQHIQDLVDAGFVERRKDGRSFRLILTQKFYTYFDLPPGAEGLQKALKDVKPPEKKDIKKIGNLQVVDVPQETQKKLDGLEIVDSMSDPSKPKITFENNKPDNGFLDEFEKRLDEVRKKNDELQKDELFLMKGNPNAEEAAAAQAQLDNPVSDKKDIWGDHKSENAPVQASSELAQKEEKEEKSSEKKEEDEFKF